MCNCMCVCRYLFSLLCITMVHRVIPKVRHAYNKQVLRSDQFFSSRSGAIISDIRVPRADRPRKDRDQDLFSSRVSTVRYVYAIHQVSTRLWRYKSRLCVGLNKEPNEVVNNKVFKLDDCVAMKMVVTYLSNKFTATAVVFKQTRDYVTAKGLFFPFWSYTFSIKICLLLFVYQTHKNNKNIKDGQY